MSLHAMELHVGDIITLPYNLFIRKKRNPVLTIISVVFRKHHVAEVMWRIANRPIREKRDIEVLKQGEEVRRPVPNFAKDKKQVGNLHIDRS